ncbi:MAG: lytic transglycosylase domain-containing protein [Acidobacteria bacterium]|nr:lytic transglycosylase domain-containing protein [Acidobacteriota bacterium]MBV9623043.1 lytic transglycosylase domain-containing protein [Acidobacteriota bacterium]
MKCLSCVVLLIFVGRAKITCARPPDKPAEYWVEIYAERYGVPVELVEAIIDTESGWNPLLVSPKGAAGIMQLMPETAVRFGVRNRFHIEENVRGGVAYLAWLSARFGGDLRLVSAAYYVGERAIAARGLAYSSPDVQGYVLRIARQYRSHRVSRHTAAVAAASPK